MRVLIAIAWQLSVVASFCCTIESGTDTAVMDLVWTDSPPARSLDHQNQRWREKHAEKVKQVAWREVNGRRVTIQEIEPPAERVAHSEKLVRKNPKRLSEIALVREATPSPKHIIVTAAIYGEGEHALSEVSLRYDGKQSKAWFLADFHLMTGFTQFKANGRTYFMISSAVKGSGKPDMRHRRRLQDAGFFIIDREKNNEQAQRIFADLLKLYRVERNRLQRAHQLREYHAAFRLLNPSPARPAEPVTIRFWKRNVENERREFQQQERRGK